jgi:hypothetical protein
MTPLYLEVTLSDLQHEFDLGAIEAPAPFSPA